MGGFLYNMDVLTVMKGYANIDFVEKRFTKVNILSKEWRRIHETFRGKSDYPAYD